jgi:hypothetical protein
MESTPNETLEATMLCTVFEGSRLIAFRRTGTPQTIANDVLAKLATMFD